MYVGNDEIGYLCIDAETAGNFNYSSSIENTYNKVKLTYDNEKTGKRDVYIAQDSNNINLFVDLFYSWRFCIICIHCIANIQLFVQMRKYRYFLFLIDP